MPRLTLCMIVRDEEVLLPGCLDSARSAVDEMVVVDTGSQDATKRIASRAGARVYDFAWCDDFAAARNEALRHARGYWVLHLDADERLGPGAARVLRSSIAKATFDAGMIRIHNAARIDARAEHVISGRDRLGEAQLAMRLLRRTDGLAFVDSIHENVWPWLTRRGSKVVAIDADIVHLGGSEDIIETRGKTGRNVQLLRRRVERNPDDVTALGYLAHEYIRAGALDEAYEASSRGWEHARSAVERSMSLHRLATAHAFLLIGRRRFAEAREVARLAQEIEGQRNPDSSFFEGQASECEALEAPEGPERTELLLAARARYTECLGFGDRAFPEVFVVGARDWYGWTRLGTVDLLLGRPSDALRAFDRAIASRPTDRAPRLGKAEATLALGQPADALVQVKGLLDETTADAWILAAWGARSVGLGEESSRLAERAKSLLAKGLIGPHREARLRDLLAETGG